jgi:hypothetical protein
MKFILNLSTENDAFQPDPRPELVAVLRHVANEIERGEDIRFFRTIYDCNGNDIGRYALKPKDYR